VEGASQIAIDEGIRQSCKETRREHPHKPEFGKRRTDWHRHAVSAYTWLRTNKGPQKPWLHYIGKSDDPSCPCGHPRQDGDHITFHCRRFEKERANLLGPLETWEKLGGANWRKEEGVDSYSLRYVIQ